MRDIYTHIFFFQREDHGGSYESTCMRFFLYCSCLRLHLSPLCSQLYVMQSALTKWDVSDFVFCPYVRSHFHINTMYRKLKSLKSFFGGLLSTKWIISVLLLLLRRTFNIVYWFHRIDTYVLLTKNIIFITFHATATGKNAHSSSLWKRLSPLVILRWIHRLSVPYAI